MKTIGIIAEYNPFHNGHQYHLKEAKRLSGAQYAVVVMSGDYVQRGTPAITDKYTRAKMALEHGADLVFELPTAYATAGAEQFAFGSISILTRLQFVDSVCFGCETPSVHTIKQIAQTLVEQPASYKNLLQKALQNQTSYPVARAQALTEYFSSTYQESASEFSEFLKQPNNILAIEYQKACLVLSSHLELIPLTRKQAGYHSSQLTGNFASASGLRKNFLKNKDFSQINPFLPALAAKDLQEQYEKTFPIHENDFSSLLYYKLLQKDDWTQYGEVTEDFCQKIKKHLSPQLQFSTLAQQLKSKDLVYTRICRNLLHILLEIPHLAPYTEPPYARLLGFKKGSSHLLKEAKALPIITKVADAKKILSEDALSQFNADLERSHLYQHICYQKYGHVCASEYAHGPVILP